MPKKKSIDISLDLLGIKYEFLIEDKIASYIDLETGKNSLYLIKVNFENMI